MGGAVPHRSTLNDGGATCQNIREKHSVSNPIWPRLPHIPRTRRHRPQPPALNLEAAGAMWPCHPCTERHTLSHGPLSLGCAATSLKHRFPNRGSLLQTAADGVHTPNPTPSQLDAQGSTLCCSYPRRPKVVQDGRSMILAGELQRRSSARRRSPAALPGGNESAV